MRLTLFAQAKINLTLEVLRRRDDGFHEIRTVMQRIMLADRLTLESANELTLRCSDHQLEGPDNLVLRAALLLHETCGVTPGALMTLEKSIPVAAGLGGGSADSAAALKGLNELWGLGVPHGRLSDLGSQLGSDVPFFMGESPAALAEGRGERLSALHPLPARWVVLLKPPVGISAGAVYGRFPRERWSDGDSTVAWLARAAQSGTVPRPFNALEAIALEIAPDAARAREALLRVGAPHPVMSGSGSTYFSLFESEAEARRIHEQLTKEAFGRAILARFATL